MRAIVVLLVLGLAGAVPARAASLPQYDPEAHCRKVANSIGAYSAMIDKGCLEMEQGAYDSLKGTSNNTRWPAPRKSDSVIPHDEAGGDGSWGRWGSTISTSG
ncbi:MAG: hypothetical protein WBD76_07830, partial [Methyloceanibacter sp.]